MRLNRLLTSFTLSVLVSACVHKGLNPVDPYEAMNRKIYCFNKSFDAAFVRPTAKLYCRIVPNPIRKGVNNFYNNLDMVPTVVNDLLQAEIKCAFKDSLRFLFNSSLGIGGLLDVASKMALPAHYNDLGLTLAKWGDRHSPYLVIPFIGPSTIRDGAGMLFQFALYSPYVYLRNNALIYSLLGLRVIDFRAQFIDSEHLLDEALDEYSMFRDAYLQHRGFLIAGTMEDNGSSYVDESEPEPTLGNDYVDE